jgi:hypothetical protein
VQLVREDIEKTPRDPELLEKLLVAAVHGV